MLDRVLVPARAGALLALTGGMYGAYEVEAALAAQPRRSELLAKWRERWARSTLRLFGIQVLTSGPHLDEGKPYPAADSTGRGRIFVMNHRSGLDIALALRFADARLVSRADLGSWPIVGGLARRLGTVFVNRSDIRSGAAALGAMVRAIRAGEGVFLFPEGTTFEGDIVRPFKGGAARLAQLTGAEIVPFGVAYEDPRAAYLDETFSAHVARVTAIPRCRAALAVGDPIAAEPEGDVAERARAAVEQLVGSARRMLGT